MTPIATMIFEGSVWRRASRGPGRTRERAWHDYAGAEGGWEEPIPLPSSVPSRASASTTSSHSLTDPRCAGEQGGRGGDARRGRDLGDEERDLIRRRDWKGMIHYGVIFFMLEKLGAVTGVSNPAYLRRDSRAERSTTSRRPATPDLPTAWPARTTTPIAAAGEVARPPPAPGSLGLAFFHPGPAGGSLPSIDLDRGQARGVVMPCFEPQVEALLPALGEARPCPAARGAPRALDVDEHAGLFGGAALQAGLAPVACSW